ncbi:flagellar biosynthetic protein FliO [Vibrio sp. Vb2880]|uniref:Flagellar protein n=1 Tax=Vibrio furnissii TaxID=29494 RepID=A0A0Q2MHL9_VIBFU|nr:MULTISPECIES: flagellar biosynthetic protein FliO [Vibrio]ADT86385.1 polar flagellar assembly protein FliO [Vibrio furnissii NCTC 11218]EEX42390.1 flagellar biosynthesis protein FliO [Vibrio furnissii CIP 102972]KQH87409.1 flagellar biosynthesis protein FliO [Vibrio furnissii]MBO0212576.1 flagellar biosynthetic protein FliO [Vibrio sp. Vb2880]MCG6214422.1 flagellar biosynthetic protein FliO [Vibrio furnissii]
MKKFISLGLFSAPALAAENTSLDLATTFGSLLFVIALILFMAWLLKRMRVPAFGQQKGLSVVRQLPVGTKERVMIVQAGDAQFLIGVTSQSIQLISKLETPLKQEELESTPFSNQLTQLLKKHDKKTSE